MQEHNPTLMVLPVSLLPFRFFLTRLAIDDACLLIALVTFTTSFGFVMLYTCTVVESSLVVGNLARADEL